MTSRILSQDTGEELLQTSVAQRYYFDEQKRHLPNTTTTNTSRKSDVLPPCRDASRQTHGRRVSFNTIWTTTNCCELTRRFAGNPAFVRCSISFRLPRKPHSQRTSHCTSPRVPRQLCQNDARRGASKSNNLQSKKVNDVYAGFEYAHDCWIFPLGRAAQTQTTRSWVAMVKGTEQFGINAPTKPWPVK